MSMAQTMTVWCYAHGRDGDWEALCVDLDIAVQGRSFEEVRGLLNEAVATYAEDACKERPEVARQLLRRKSPFWVRMQFFAGVLIHRMLQSKSDREYRAGFDLPCPA